MPSHAVRCSLGVDRVLACMNMARTPSRLRYSDIEGPVSGTAARVAMPHWSQWWRVSSLGGGLCTGGSLPWCGELEVWICIERSHEGLDED